MYSPTSVAPLFASSSLSPQSSCRYAHTHGVPTVTMLPSPNIAITSGDVYSDSSDMTVPYAKFGSYANLSTYMAVITSSAAVIVNVNTGVSFTSVSVLSPKYAVSGSLKFLTNILSIAPRRFVRAPLLRRLFFVELVEHVVDACASGDFLYHVRAAHYVHLALPYVDPVDGVQFLLDVLLPDFSSCACEQAWQLLPVCELLGSR